jgi:hypothetical protein
MRVELAEMSQPRAATTTPSAVYFSCFSPDKTVCKFTAINEDSRNAKASLIVVNFFISIFSNWALESRTTIFPLPSTQGISMNSNPFVQKQPAARESWLYDLHFHLSQLLLQRVLIDFTILHDYAYRRDAALAGRCIKIFFVGTQYSDIFKRIAINDQEVC